MQKTGNKGTSKFTSELGCGSWKSTDFSDRLKSKREELGLTQLILANKLGISLSSVQNYESGKLPRGEHLLGLSRVLSCSIDWLMFGEEAHSLNSQPLPATGEPPPLDDDFKMSDMLTMTAEVLESETIFRTALASNIRAFHQAVRSERTLSSLIDRVELLERKMEGLERENRQLKQNQEQLSHAKAVGEEG